MLEKLYNQINRKEETASTLLFLSEYVKGNDEMEELFLKAIRDTHHTGFKDGMRTAIDLLKDA
ncbi:MAG: hypothetical protein LUD77_02010 [Clostridiales bacterium]|nr:hypothetical protein [Clostridiales bacterium]